jgi:hypothetical protein
MAWSTDAVLISLTVVIAPLTSGALSTGRVVVVPDVFVGSADGVLSGFEMVVVASKAGDEPWEEFPPQPIRKLPAAMASNASQRTYKRFDISPPQENQYVEWNRAETGSQMHRQALLALGSKKIHHDSA